MQNVITITSSRQYSVTDAMSEEFALRNVKLPEKAICRISSRMAGNHVTPSRNVASTVILPRMYSARVTRLGQVHLQGVGPSIVGDETGPT